MSRLAGGKSAADLRGYLEGAEFPIRKDELVHTARRRGAPQDVVDALEGLPSTDYARFEDVVRDYPPLPDEEDVGGDNRR